METIVLVSYAHNGNMLGMDRNLDEGGNETSYPTGTFESLRSMQHPELEGLEKHENASRWDFYCFETGDMLFVNEEGIIE